MRVSDQYLAAVLVFMFAVGVALLVAWTRKRSRERKRWDAR
jgi:hypothetical protein